MNEATRNAALLRPLSMKQRGGGEIINKAVKTTLGNRTVPGLLTWVNKHTHRQTDRQTHTQTLLNTELISMQLLLCRNSHHCPCIYLYISTSNAHHCPCIYLIREDQSLRS